LAHTIVNNYNRGDSIMGSTYCKKELQSIAQECQKFEHIITAMGYGYSLLNVSPNDFVRRCNDCIYWLGSDCEIFQHEIMN